MRLITLKIDILFCAITAIFYCSALSPVILIPGDGGNQLEAKLNKSNTVHYICAKSTNDYFNIWLNLELLMPVVIDCWVDNTRLIYNETTRTTSTPPGVDIRAPGWGTTESVEWIDPSRQSVGNYFKDIAATLVSIGYARNVSIRGAPYDFRKGPNENARFFPDLKDLVEETYKKNNNTPVTLISHSMGGKMALMFLQKQSAKWKSQFIKRFISLSAPWAGSMKAIKVFAIGDDLGSLVLRESVLKQQQISCPSLAYLLPSPMFWKSDEVLVQTEKFNYTIKDLEKYFNDLDYMTGWEMSKDMEQYSKDFSPPGVETHCLYGTDVPTVERLVYPKGTWLDGYPKLTMGDGDGTVNLRSLQACQHWKKKRKFFNYGSDVKVKTVPIAKADHLKMLHDKQVLDYIHTVMQN